MLTDTYELNFTFFNVGGGDAIWIRFLGTDGEWHNILIDGGYGQTYKDAFGPLINSITQQERIDLWVISHIDLDHIGAALGFMQDRKIQDKKTAVNKFWFNYSPMPIKVGTGKLSVAQGMKFREYLRGEGLLGEEGINTQMPETELWGLKIRVLSPSPEKARIAADLWEAEEIKGKLARSAEKSDHKISFEELISKEFKENAEPWNGSSISLLLEFKGIKVLLLADSHPSAVAASLRALNVSPEAPLVCAFMQLSHHGSKANTHADLLSLIRTSTYVVTGNGITNRHPDKETLVRVLTRKGRPEGLVEFVFPAETRALQDIFADDGDVFSRYQFKCTFPESGRESQSLKYLPIKDIEDE